MVVDETQRTSSDSQVLTVRAATLSSCLWAVALTVVAAAIFARREVRCSRRTDRDRCSDGR